MRCAVYARRSTEEHQVASLDTQVNEAARYISGKGWTLAPEHVYRDDAVSRAEFKKRPGLIAMLNALKSGEFDAIVLRDDTRLGGDMHRTGLVIQDIIEHDVRLFCYFEDDEIKLDGATDRMMQALRGFAAELEREKIAGRTREHLETKARRGVVTGGVVYGYTNVRHEKHVDHVINPDEAPIVVEVFERRAKGESCRSIARSFNTRGVPAPKAGKRGSGSWAPAMIREMTMRERYAGSIAWGKHAKMYRGGTKVRLERPEAERIRVVREDLRIVPQELWETVQRRNAETAEKWGAAGKGALPRYLLSGIARCAECGGPIGVVKTRVRTYGCNHHRDRGAAVCGASLRRPVEAVDSAVVDWIQANVLSEEVVAAALAEVRRRLAERAERPNEERDQLEAEARQLRAEIDRLVMALASGVESPTIGAGIAEREQRLTAVKARLAVLQTAPSVLDLEVRRLEKEALGRISDLRGLLARSVTEGRQALAALLEGPMRFRAVETPEGRRFQVEGSAAVGSYQYSERPQGDSNPYPGVFWTAGDQAES